MSNNDIWSLTGLDNSWIFFRDATSPSGSWSWKPRGFNLILIKLLLNFNDLEVSSPQVYSDSQIKIVQSIGLNVQEMSTFKSISYIFTTKTYWSHLRKSFNVSNSSQSWFQRWEKKLSGSKISAGGGEHCLWVQGLHELLQASPTFSYWLTFKIFKFKFNISLNLDVD